MNEGSWRDLLAPWAQVVEGASGRGSVGTSEIGGARLALLAGSPVSLVWTPGAGPPVWVGVLARGAATLHQGGHAWELAAGSLVLVDGRQPVALATHAPFRLVALGVAGPRLTLGTLDPERQAVDRLLGDALLALAADGPGRPALVAAALALVAGCSAARPPEADSARLRRADRYIDEHLADPALTPEQVAEAQQVSRRWLDKAFAARGETLAGAIAERRLAAAAGLLDAGRVSVGEVAVRCGFPSSSALSHAFRKRFGVPPSEWGGGR